MTRVLTDRDADETFGEEQGKVVEFRFTWLRDAGYSTQNADKIAHDLSQDWHFAVKLRKQCDDEKLCMRILYGS